MVEPIQAPSFDARSSRVAPALIHRVDVGEAAHAHAVLVGDDVEAVLTRGL